MGWTIIPAYRAEHPSGGKLPLGKEWEQSQRMRVDEEVVETWSGNRPYNIAILTGAPSGIFVVDIDPGSGGVESMKALIAEHGPFPATFVVQTGGGGWHYYFQMPGDFDVRNSQSKVGRGIDVRGTGGFVVGPGSVSNKGPYSVVTGYAPAPAPAWLLEAVKPKERTVPAIAPAPGGPKPEEPTPYELKIVKDEIARLDALPRPWREGAGWDHTTFEVACTLTEIANSSWAALTHGQVEALIMNHAPYDTAWDERATKIGSARQRVGSAPRAHGPTRIPDSDFFSGVPQATAVSQDSGHRVIAHDNIVDVGNHALAARWLMEEIGVGRLSGVFYRKGDLVYTPRVGEEGYVEPRNAVAEGAASITIMSEHDLQARIQQRYDVVRMVEDKGTHEWKPKPAIFPLESAKVVVRAADDAPHLRTLHGVVHAPTFRPDGSLITQPGYDAATGLLFLPTGGQPNLVPDEPSVSDVQMAVKILDYMLQDFRFVTDHDRASYIGLMLTPLLRSIVPAPYKLGVIEAHQPGSGKSFLARALASIHGGVLHAEMPADEAELAKVIGSILDTQTSPVVAFDNVTGLVRSSTLAGLLTSPTFQGRRLGSSTVIEADNDRLWVITGNNAALSGDLSRRNVRVRIDPGVPNPEMRTEFAISDFEGWVREHRGDLLWSLLVIVRHWVVRGMPFIDTPTGDSYGRWVSTLRAITHFAGMPGSFDDLSTRADAVDPEADDFRRFLEIVHDQMQGSAWTAKSLLGLVAHPAMQIEDPSKPIPYDALPADLVHRARTVDPSSLAAPLGRWLTNRQGRWFGDLCVKRSSQKTKHGTVWHIEVYEPRS